MNVIIYGSKYGAARKYAKRLGELTNIEIKNFKYVQNINIYETIIYIGALYAVGVLGLEKTFKKIKDINRKKIIIATVGLSDPNNPENIKNIHLGIQKQISEELFESAHFYHLRGGIDYKNLSLKHKIMMKLLYLKAKKTPKSERSPETNDFVNTYNTKVDFIDYKNLRPIIQELYKE
jgi:menaquinone-dependent protoporphyrinogen IX oxidase